MADIGGNEAKGKQAAAWTTKERARALRGEKAAIVREWQLTVQSTLWHIDSAQFTRKSAAMQCAGDTLNTLTSYVEGEKAPETKLEEEASEHETHSEPSEISEKTEPQGPPPSFSVEHLENTVSGKLASLRALLKPCAERWCELPPAWGDKRIMLEILAGQTEQALIRRGANAETLEISNGFFSTLLYTAGDLQIHQLDQQLASHREEFAFNQHLAGRFLANASHELRTPLTAVLGFAELLQEGTYGPVTPEQIVAIGHIENSAQNLLEVINNLLDLLRVRSGNLTLQLRPVAVAPLCRHIYEILTPLASRNKVTFVIDMPDDLGYIEADDHILRHIVYHLLASALRATPNGGTVTLSASRSQTTLTITTHDTALHLPAEALANMAESFPRLENSPARGYEGWEVGLPLVRRYVELHDGKLELESLPDEGTTFRILLPVSQ